MRFGLHVLTGRREDRLLFDYQIKLAKLFGYEDASFTLAVEQLMQKYYRTVMDVSLLNEMLLQLFREAILTQSGPPMPINARFQIRNDYLEVTHPEVFARYPSALLELFVLLQQHPELRGVRAETIRLIGSHVSLIDEEFRQNPRHHRLFMEILCAPVGVTHELRRMNLYGVLGRYIPAFGRVVGRMQYDLFHAYTVDAHTLFVVSNLRRLAMPKYNHEFPMLSQIMQSLPRQELAYLAALFHDIAKGRGGDHSELGAVDAEAFCLEQGLGRYEARLVAWLVRNHLDPVHHLAEEGHQRSGHHPRFRAPRRRPGPPRLPVRAHRRGRARHQPEAVERLEGAAVRGVLRAHQARAAPRPRDAGRPGRTDPRDPGERARKNVRRSSPNAISRGLVAVDRGVFPALHARGDRLADGAARRPASRRRVAAGRRSASWPSAAAPRYSPTPGGSRTVSRAPLRCSTRWASTSSMRASSRAPTASAWKPTWCSRITAR